MASDHTYAPVLAHLRTCRDQLAAQRVNFDDGPDTWTTDQLHAVIAYAAAWRNMLVAIRDRAPHPLTRLSSRDRHADP